jgi:hypothetical protein
MRPIVAGIGSLGLGSLGGACDRGRTVPRSRENPPRLDTIWEGPLVNWRLSAAGVPLQMDDNSMSRLELGHRNGCLHRPEGVN